MLIMQPGNSSNVSSALDDLIPLSDVGLAPPTAVASNNPAFDSFDSMPSSNPFGMGPMGGGSSSMSNMGGLPPAPSMAPPPPPMEPPPPPPPPAAATMVSPSSGPPDNAVNNSLRINPSVEQMQEMIKQQQAQMNQMMQMMQQMQTPGGSTNVNSNGAMGSWPPS